MKNIQGREFGNNTQEIYNNNYLIIGSNAELHEYTLCLDTISYKLSNHKNHDFFFHGPKKVTISFFFFSWTF